VEKWGRSLERGSLSTPSPRRLGKELQERKKEECWTSREEKRGHGPHLWFRKKKKVSPLVMEVGEKKEGKDQRGEGITASKKKKGGLKLLGAKAKGGKKSKGRPLQMKTQFKKGSGGSRGRSALMGNMRGGTKEKFAETTEASSEVAPNKSRPRQKGLTPKRSQMRRKLQKTQRSLKELENIGEEKVKLGVSRAGGGSK